MNVRNGTAARPERALSSTPVLSPSSLPRAVFKCLVGSAFAFAVCAWIWGTQTAPWVGTLLAVGWVLLVFANRDLGRREAIDHERVKADVLAEPPLLRLALAMAQPLRSLELSMPIPSSMQCADWGLFALDRLRGANLGHARAVCRAWVGELRTRLGLSETAPLSFEQGLVFIELAQTGDAASACRTLHRILCAMDTGNLAKERGIELLEPCVRQLQLRYASWAAYASALRKDPYDLVAKTAWGRVALWVQLGICGASR